MKDIFIWDNNFLTNNTVIDNQHLQLIDIINEAIKNTIDDKNYSQNIYYDLKEKIFNYINQHFKTEEKIMDESNVFELHSIEHKKAHEEFAAWFKVTFKDNEISLSQLYESLEYLIQWLAYHILNTDKCLFKQIEMIKSGISPIDAFNIEQKKKEQSTEPLVKALKALYYIVLEKNQKLEIANNTLEHNVRQRTMELEEANKRLESISLTDPLTGLPNRRYIEIILDQIVETWKRYKSNFIVMFIDVDKFKNVNDTKGHDVGDSLLRWIAEFLKAGFRKSDIICRLGGDEFVVICPETDINTGISVADKLIGKLKGASNTDFRDFWEPSLSIGLCDINEQTNTTDSILKKADEAMYKSKKQGGNVAIASN